MLTEVVVACISLHIFLMCSYIVTVIVFCDLFDVCHLLCFDVCKCAFIVCFDVCKCAIYCMFDVCKCAIYCMF